MTTDTKDSLEDQIAHLTAGADATPVLEGVERTAGQFIHWFLELGEEKRTEVAERILLNSAEASSCFMRDHEGRIEELNRLVQLGAWLIGELRWIATHPEEFLAQRKAGIR